MFIEKRLYERFRFFAEKMRYDTLLCDRVDYKSAVMSYHGQLEIDTAYFRLG